MGTHALPVDLLDNYFVERGGGVKPHLGPWPLTCNLLAYRGGGWCHAPAPLRVPRGVSPGACPQGRVPRGVSPGACPQGVSTGRVPRGVSPGAYRGAQGHSLKNTWKMFVFNC